MDVMTTTRAMTSTALRCAFTETSLDQLVQDRQVLAVITHGPDVARSASAKVIPTGMPQLGGNPCHEVWTTAAGVETLTVGPVRMAKTPDLLLASIAVPATGGIAEATRQAYELLLQAIRAQGYPCLLRAWNYMADINRGTGDSECYKQFCAGRHVAFSQQGVSEKDYPAASALGHDSPELLIYLFSARFPGIHIENPRQQSAYTYPKIYGSKSPTFARATVSPELGLTFVSGTASITGHETLHADDVDKQLELTLSNIRHLVDRIETTHNLRLGSPLFKVYVRHPEHQARIRTLLASRFPELPSLYLRADVCRADLLLEIEAVYHHA